MDKKIKYFYCGSTQALLYALAHDDYIIVSPTATAKKMCNILERTLIEVKIKVCLKNLIIRPIKIKKELTRLIDIIGKGELHFSHTQFAVFCFILIDKASKENIPVFFHDFEFIYALAAKINISIQNFKIYIQKLLVDLIYSVDLSFKDLNNNLVISIDDNFISHRNIVKIHDKDSYYEQTLTLFLNAPKLTKIYTHVFLTQNLLHNNFFDRNDLITLYRFLGQKKVNVKLHPGMKEEEAIYFSDLTVKDNDLPAEFFFNSVEYSIISVHSAALITASKFEHLKSVSLLNLLVPKDKTVFGKIKDDLVKKSCGKIIFPKTLDELDEILYVKN